MTVQVQALCHVTARVGQNLRCQCCRDCYAVNSAVRCTACAIDCLWCLLRICAVCVRCDMLEYSSVCARARMSHYEQCRVYSCIL